MRVFAMSVMAGWVGAAPAWAHPQHGVVPESWGLWHYVLEPAHAWALMGLAAGVVVLWRVAGRGSRDQV